MANVIKTILTYPLTGQTEFNIPFEYLARKFVVVTLIGVDRKELTLGIDYRFATKTTIVTNSVWGQGDGYTAIEIRRFTSATERLVDFMDGSILRAYDLNVAQLQTNHVAEEARDMTSATLGTSSDGMALDARGRRLVNLLDGVDPQDAATIHQLSVTTENVKESLEAAKEAAETAISASKDAQKSAQDAAGAAGAILVTLSGDHGFGNIGGATYAQIRSYSGKLSRVYCLGRSNIADGGYGFFEVDLNDNSSADNGGTVLVDALQRRWKRQYSGAVDMLWFASGDGKSDDTTAFANACSLGEKIVVPNGEYFLSNATLDTLPNRCITIAEGTHLVGSGAGSIIKTDSNIGTYPSKALFLCASPNILIKGLVFDGAMTHTGNLTGLPVMVRVTAAAENFTLEDSTIRNMYASTFVYAIAINVGCRNYRVSNVSFRDMDVLADGIEGNLNGTLNGIYIGYDQVGGDPRSNLGYGTIENIIGVNFGPYEDSDLIHCISNSGASPYSHYSDIKIRNITAINVGKRAVKMQVNGASCVNVFADARNITTTEGYMFSIVAALNGKQVVSGVRGIGKFKAAISCCDTTNISGVSVDSTWETTPSGVCCGLLHDFGAELDADGLRFSGTFKNSIYVRNTNTTRPLNKVSLTDVVVSTPAEQVCIAIDAGNADNVTVGSVVIDGADLSTSSNAANVIVVLGYVGTSPLVQKLRVNNVKLKGNGYATTLSAYAVEFETEGMTSDGAGSFAIEVIRASSVTINSLTSSAKIANLVSCSKTMTGSTRSGATSGSANRYDSGTNHIINGMILNYGVTSHTALSGAANIQTFNVINFAS